MEIYKFKKLVNRILARPELRIDSFAGSDPLPGSARTILYTDLIFLQT